MKRTEEEKYIIVLKHLEQHSDSEEFEEDQLEKRKQEVIIAFYTQEKQMVEEYVSQPPD